MNQKLEVSIFNKVLDILQAPSYVDREFLYSVYDTCIDIINQFNENDALASLRNINQVELISYCIGEYIYTFGGTDEKLKAHIIELENENGHISSVVADKFLSLSYFSHDEGAFTNKYLPSISSLNLYLNFILNILNNYKKNDPVSTLITDLLNKSVSIARCVLSLLVDGYETEAFALWRTLHECECTLVLLEKYGEPMINSYLKHMQYALAYSGAVKDKNTVDATFEKLKGEMKTHDLKSKDMKKFIEYGWLYAVPGVSQTELKLNFRDGLQKLAGLEHYNKVYVMSSEIIHSTPLLVYSDKQYFYYMTLLNLYESFFRLERVFVSLFASRVNQEQFDSYKKMQSVYYSQLIAIHQRESKTYFNIIKRRDQTSS
ncbi:MAG: hypothetical protein E7181_00105 [Erysipelotrichaceae bacterium]|nr:hypothetical protein [Erysipelotrichaceae bacterium]